MKQSAILFFILLIQISYGQNIYEPMAVDIYQNNTLLEFPFVGGLDRPQFTDADLNNDGLQDLVLFDRADNQIITFINNGSTGNIDYVYAPEYEANFPAVSIWILLEDYNCDGIDDLFVGLSKGVMVYQGYYSSNQLNFQLVTADLLYSPDNLSIPIIFEDIPALTDVDNDGDLDFLVNNTLSGRWIGWFRNRSQENGNACNDLDFVFETYCWGDIHMFSTVYQNDTCPTTPPSPNMRQSSNGLHAQKNFLAIDMDADMDKDLILSSGNLADLHFLQNDGTPTVADINNVSLSFPLTTTPSTLTFQASMSYFDIDNDGINELITSRSEGGPIRTDNTAWYYENTNVNNQPIFSFVEDEFLTNRMIDVGLNAAPVFVDYNTDGLLDMVIGNYGWADASGSNHYGQLALYENTGTPTTPEFTLVDPDFANISTYQLQFLRPAFGDMDADGDPDMVLGEKDGNLFYFENSGGIFNINVSAIGYDVGQFSTPFLYDMDDDGDLDMISGAQGGNIYFYRNTGTPSLFNFQVLTSNFGGISGNSFSVPFIHEWGDDHKPHLFISFDNQITEIYTDYNGLSPTAPAILVSTNIVNSPMDDYRFLSMHGGDINGDTYPELVIGHIRGGIAIYEEPCPPPYQITLVDSTTNTMDLAWQGNGNDYTVEYSLLNSGTWTTVNSNNNTYTLNGLQECAAYIIRIEADCGSWSSVYSIQDTFGTAQPSAAWTAPTSVAECDIPVDLSPQITGATGGTWSGGAYISAAGLFDPSGLTPGTAYPVTYEVGTPVCNSSTLSITITAAPDPNWTLPAAIQACEAPIDLTPQITGDIGGTWSGGSYINAAGTFDPSGLTAGNYTVTYTIGIGSCQQTSSQSMIVDPSPTATWAYTTPLMPCEATVDLNPSVTGDTGGTWSGGTYISATGIFDPSGLSAGTYTVDYTVGSGTCQVSENQSITIINDPSASWTIPAAIQACDPPIDLSPQITGDTGGTWSGGSYVDASGQFDPNGLTAGTYAVTYTVGTGACQAIQSQSITINPPPSAAWTAPTGIIRPCDAPIDLTSQITGDTGGTWSGGSYISAAGQFDPSGLTAGTYMIDYTTGTGTCQVNQTQSITISPNPSAAWNANTSLAACDNPLDLTAQITGDTGGTWSGGTYINSTGIFDPTGLSVGTYNVTYAVGMGACMDSQTATVMVTAAPSAAWSPPIPFQNCIGTVDLSPQVSGNAGGTWSGGTYISTTGIFDPTGLNPGTYSVTYAVGTGTCVDNQTELVTVTAPPSATWAAPSAFQACVGVVDLNPQVSGDTGGTWSGGAYINSAGIFDPTGLSVGNYTVTYTVGTGTCAMNQTANLTLLPPNDATWQLPLNSIQNCDAPISLNGQITGDTGGTWSGGAYIGPTGIFDPNGLNVGTYPVTYTVGNGSCAVSNTQNITINDAPNPAWSAPNPLESCAIAIDLNTQVTGDSGGTWSGGTYISSSGIFNPTGLIAGTYAVVYTVGSGNCSFSETQSITVLAPPSPAWTLPAAVIPCEGSINLAPNITGTTGGTWSGGAYIDASGQFDPRGLSAGNYTVIYTVGSGSCVQTLGQQITVASDPSAALSSANGAVLDCDMPFDLNNFVVGTNGGAWTIEGTPSNGIFDPSVYPSGNTYVASYTVGLGACTDMSTIAISVAPCGGQLTIQLKALLEGAFDVNTNEMSTLLNTESLLPLSQPYNQAPWNYNGLENVSSLPLDVVDWVLIEARLAIDTSIVEQKAALLYKDGTIKDVNDPNGVLFSQLLINQSYFFIVRHRHHLDVMTATAITPPNATPYDFTMAINQAAGNGQMKLVGGKAVLYAGDVNGDGIFTVVDYNDYRMSSSAINQYILGDLNFDSVVTVADFNLYQPNAAVLGYFIIRY